MRPSSADEKSANPRQQQPVQTPAAVPSAKAVQPQQPVQAIPVGAVASQASPNIANLASQTQFARSTKN